MEFFKEFFPYIVVVCAAGAGVAIDIGIVWFVRRRGAHKKINFERSSE